MGEDFAKGIRAQFSEHHFLGYNTADTEAPFWPNSSQETWTSLSMRCLLRISYSGWKQLKSWSRILEGFYFYGIKSSVCRLWHFFWGYHIHVYARYTRVLLTNPRTWEQNQEGLVDSVLGIILRKRTQDTTLCKLLRSLCSEDQP